MEDALYGPDGFYRTGGGPAAHFATSPLLSESFADALVTLVRRAGLCRLIDVGAGAGELATAVQARAPELEVCAVDIGPRPHALPATVRWARTVPPCVDGLVVANEWLDTVPVEIAESTSDGLRTVLVDPDGAEFLGGPLDVASQAWCERWWPIGDEGDRIEVGLARDDAWAGLVASVRRSIVVAVDYAHSTANRPVAGTLTGYRDGQQVPPRADGSTDVTAHVALDSCAVAGRRAGATDTVVLPQHRALRALGIDAAPPPLADAGRNPLAYAARLADAGRAARLLDPGGLGGFTWLVQAIGTTIPAEFVTAAGADDRPQPGPSRAATIDP